jgi:glucose/mannose transport system substrate-binding protein
MEKEEMMKLCRGLMATVMVTGALSVATAARAEESVEVLHWWTSGGEAKALNVLKETLQKQGITWKDMPVAGGGGTQAMTALKARVAAGNPPAAVQLLGFDVTDWAEQGVLADISAVAEKNGWEKVVPPALQAFSKYKGKWIAAPVNVHSTNWVWINKALFDKAGGKTPQNWDEFVALLDKFKAAGAIPLAQGGQPWQDATLFDSVVMTTGGLDFYKKALIDLDYTALGSDTMTKVFERMSQLRGYFDNNRAGRDWNLATAMVIKGEAGAQIMGDWAKGEFVTAGKTPDVDYVCIRFPGTQGTVTFNSDQFAAFKVGKEQQGAQLKLVAAVEDPSFQSAFNVIKGSAPARIDVSDSAFDACGKKAMADLKEASSKGTLIGSFAHGHANRAPIKLAMYDVITRELNGQLDPKAAAKALVEAVKNAQ